MLRPTDELLIAQYALFQLTQQGNSEEAESKFAEAISMARSMPYPYAEAVALLEYGLLDIARGQPNQGWERLREASAIFRRLGARKDLERTEQSLTRRDGSISHREA